MRSKRQARGAKIGTPSKNTVTNMKDMGNHVHPIKNAVAMGSPKVTGHRKIKGAVSG